ncbi:MAG: hypothetical protein US88_C0017G0007 [Parcubacteria group bacterium GW2011_GWA2_38_27]|nr:MAG: hypothetical protein US88_C0017G0007 [Parcubacteria group bacterium GW2011_GWA2_38_27]
MQIFDLRFNPKLKEERSFASFIYEPENIYEKKLGSLYTVGELKNGLPGSHKFLDQINAVIKKNYYKISFKSPEKALKECLKKTNSYLGEELKKDNVQWLGNLNFCALCVKDMGLNFTKTGELKVILIRGGQINDIGKGLDSQEIDPYPLRIFFNVVSGRLADNDIILALTKETFCFFESQNILTKIALCQEITSKKIKEIFPAELFSKGEGAKISGLCFLIIAKKKPSAGKIHLSNVIFEKTEVLFSLPKIKKISVFIQKIIKTISLWKGEILSFSYNIYKLPDKISKKAKTKLKKFNPVKEFKNLFSKKKLAGLSLKSFIQFIEKFRRKPDTKRGLIFVSLFFFLILAGSFVFKATNQIKEKSDKQAEINLKQIAEQELLKANKLEKIKAPEALFELKEEILGFKPEKFLLFDDNFYFYNPLSPNLYEYNLQNSSGVLSEAPKNITSASYLSGSLLFFSEPDTILSFEKNSWQENKIEAIDSGAELPLFFSYASNLYFFNDKCEIIKYHYLGNLKWGLPQKWVKNKTDSCQNHGTMAIDNSIWILNENNISRYYGGYLQETVNFSIYPKGENIIKIETKSALPYFYFLDPPNNRLIILEKTGAIFKQFQSEKFNDLNDFIISDDGKTIWLLNGFTIYRIEM